MKRTSDQPITVTCSDAPALTDIQRLSIVMGVPLDRVIPEIIRRIKSEKGGQA